VHLVTAYGVDGFRFDLAELLGRSLLVEIERKLKS
jgi:pullulanase/glycogen debranching enzyme